jgi:hypothetical protein
MADQRRYPRVPGPFTGKRIGTLNVPINIYDLSCGGCLVESYHQESVGRRVTLEVDLPDEGAVILDGEVRDNREGYGYAVQFVDVPVETRARLEQAIERLRPKSARTGQT